MIPSTLRHPDERPVKRVLWYIWNRIRSLLREPQPTKFVIQSGRVNVWISILAYLIFFVNTKTTILANISHFIEFDFLFQTVYTKNIHGTDLSSNKEEEL
jgi:hypothetical protein